MNIPDTLNIQVAQTERPAFSLIQGTNENRTDDV